MLERLLVAHSRVQMAVPRERTADALRAFLNTLSSGKKEIPFVQWYCNGGKNTIQRGATYEQGKFKFEKLASADVSVTPLDLNSDFRNYKGSGVSLKEYYRAELKDDPHLRGKRYAEKIAIKTPGTTVCYDGGNRYWHSLLAHIEQFLVYVDTGNMPEEKKDTAQAGTQKKSDTKRKRNNEDTEDTTSVSIEGEDTVQQREERERAEREEQERAEHQKDIVRRLYNRKGVSKKKKKRSPREQVLYLMHQVSAAQDGASAGMAWVEYDDSGNIRPQRNTPFFKVGTTAHMDERSEHPGTFEGGVKVVLLKTVKITPNKHWAGESAELIAHEVFYKKGFGGKCATEEERCDLALSGRSTEWIRVDQGATIEHKVAMIEEIMDEAARDVAAISEGIRAVSSPTASE